MSPMHLFLDANAYLGFFRLSDDNLERLQQLADSVRSDDTTLYLPDQVRDEFRRNRGAVISESLRFLENAKLPKSYPRLFTNMEGYPELRATLDQFEDQRDELVDRVRGLAIAGDLHADRLIGTLFGLAQPVPTSDAILSAAIQRTQLGNPPGKKGSIRDAVNWESLLVGVPVGAELILVSSDGDFSSSLQPAVIDEYLAEEWQSGKQASATLHGNLSSVFDAHYPQIRLTPEPVAPDPQRSAAVSALVGSLNFQSTHQAIGQLARFDEFSTEEVEALVEATMDNSQVAMILGDEDVWAFYNKLATRYDGMVDPQRLQELRDALAELEDL